MKLEELAIRRFMAGSCVPKSAKDTVSWHRDGCQRDLLTVDNGPRSSGRVREVHELPSLRERLIGTQSHPVAVHAHREKGTARETTRVSRPIPLERDSQAPGFAGNAASPERGERGKHSLEAVVVIGCKREQREGRG